ncbi:MAG TPA: hypothetical protein VL307_03140 [Chitinophagaceae bacterium]|nr:hypothetical protein [Chitinophagaceae bacterium]
MKSNSLVIVRVFCSLAVLAVGTAGLAQESGQDIQAKFSSYQEKNLQEKIFVHTDKSFYLAGEVIWFKLYTVDASFHRPIDLSKVAYVELLSAEQKPVLQASIGLEQGSGNGSFIIPSSIASGNYTLRAYSSRMKNFPPEFYFEQTISIVNTLKAALAATAPATPVYQQHFFPEAGNMVNGLPSVLACNITDQYGRPAAANGYILAGADTICPLTIAANGMGRCQLVPTKGKTYRAIMHINDTSIITPLPAALDEGYAMKVEEGTDGKTIQVSVTASNAYNNADVYLFIHSRQVVKDLQTAHLQNGSARFTISKEKLADGIAQITLFNAGRQPVAERLYFKRPLNRLRIAAQTDKTVYQPRSTVALQLEVKGPEKPAPADMSVSVFMIDSLQPARYEDIQAWLLLHSDLPGRLDDAAALLADSSVAGSLALDNLMLTRGWRRFAWNDVLGNKAPLFQFITETEGPVINGRLTDKKTGLPKGNVLTTLTVPGENFEFRSALSKEDGSIRFNVNNFYSGNDIIVQTINAADSGVSIRVTSPFSTQFSSFTAAPLQLWDALKDQLLFRSINAQADNAYLIDKKRQAFVAPALDTNVFYGKAEKQYNLDDYTRFITMDEVMKEFIVDVRVRKPADRYQFRVVNAAFKSLFEQDPLVLIDGLPVTNPDKIMAFDPLKIKRIDVATHKHYLGPLVSEGIISYKTYDGDLAGYELDPHAVVLEYEGLQRQREFYAPVYEHDDQRASRVPDLRNVLYWQPAVTLNADGKQQLNFYSSDLAARFAIVVQGINADGLAGSTVQFFTVQ